jgi:hypothetical protein
MLNTDPEDRETPVARLKMRLSCKTRLRSQMPTTLPIAARTRMGTPPLATDLKAVAGSPAMSAVSRRIPRRRWLRLPIVSPR